MFLLGLGQFHGHWCGSFIPSLSDTAGPDRWPGGVYQIDYGPVWKWLEHHKILWLIMVHQKQQKMIGKPKDYHMFFWKTAIFKSMPYSRIPYTTLFCNWPSCSIHRAAEIDCAFLSGVSTLLDGAAVELDRIMWKSSIIIQFVSALPVLYIHQV